MGCFNVAGTMSNLTIAHGDKVAFFILCPTNNQYKSVDISIPGTNLSSNAGACIVTKPYCPPIFGEYDDYGSLENIVESQTTRDLENYFGAKIKDIIDTITRLQWNDTLKSSLADDVKTKRMNEFGKLSGMFEHADVVYTMSNYIARENSVYKSAYFTNEIMELMGFKFLYEEVNEHIEYSSERYKNKWQKDNIIAYSDGKYIADVLFINNYPIKIPYSYHPCDIANLVGIDAWSSGMNKSCISMEIEMYHKAKSEYEESLKLLEESDSEYDASILRIQHAISQYSIGRFPVIVENENIGSIKDLELLHHFNCAMYSTNNFYFPAMSGEQHGNNEIDKLLHDVRGNILFNKLNREYN